MSVRSMNFAAGLFLLGSWRSLDQRCSAWLFVQVRIQSASFLLFSSSSGPAWLRQSHGSNFQIWLQG